MEGITIRGTVFKNKHETNGEEWYSYKISFSSKDREGNWENTSMPIKFVGNTTPPEDKARVVLTSAWIKPFKYKDGKVPGWYCNGYEEAEPKGEIHGYEALVQDDVPFD